MFDVKRKKDGEVFTVYSVQVMPVQNIAGQNSLAGMFLIYDKSTARWEMADAAEFEPIEVTKSAIL